MSRLHGDGLGAPIGAIPIVSTKFSPYGATGALTAWTPVLTQLGVVTNTIVTATYFQVGRMVYYQAVLSVTGAGTAANVVTVSLPVTANSSSTYSIIGQGFIFDSSATFYYSGMAVIATTTTLKLLQHGNSGVIAYQGVSTFSAALASPDVITVAGHYEAAADL